MDRGYDTRSPIQKKSSLPRTFALFRGYIFFTVVLFFAGSFFVVAYAPLFKIRTVSVSGSTMTSNENIQAWIAKIVEGDWQTILPFDSTISIPIQTLEKSIQNTFPSVASLNVKRIGVSGIEVFVTERVPVYAYCKDTHCALVDKEGVVFLISERSAFQIIEGSIAEFVRRSMATTVYDVALGKPLIPFANSIALEKIKVFLTARDFTIEKIHLAPLGFFDVQVTYGEFLKKVTFRFRDNKKIDMQIGELQLALEKGLRQKILEDKVEYVISYIPQKVIYKNTEIQN
jgi:hypothetical protein